MTWLYQLGPGCYCSLSLQPNRPVTADSQLFLRVSFLFIDYEIMCNTSLWYIIALVTKFYFNVAKILKCAIIILLQTFVDTNWFYSCYVIKWINFKINIDIIFSQYCKLFDWFLFHTFFNRKLNGLLNFWMPQICEKCENNNFFKIKNCW